MRFARASKTLLQKTAYKMQRVYAKADIVTARNSRMTGVTLPQGAEEIRPNGDARRANQPASWLSLSAPRPVSSTITACPPSSAARAISSRRTSPTSSSTPGRSKPASNSCFAFPESCRFHLDGSSYQFTSSLCTPAPPARSKSPSRRPTSPSNPIPREHHYVWAYTIQLENFRHGNRAAV